MKEYDYEYAVNDIEMTPRILGVTFDPHFNFCAPCQI